VWFSLCSTTSAGFNPKQRSNRSLSSKAFDLTLCRALTWYSLRLSLPRTHFETWKAAGLRGRGSLAARYRVADRPAQQTVVLAKSTKLRHGTKLGRTLCYISLYILPVLQRAVRCGSAYAEPPLPDLTRKEQTLPAVEYPERVKGALCALVIRIRVSYNQNDETLSRNSLRYLSKEANSTIAVN